ncbi:hypothetical protein [uncultured Sunxiuqinia sp.]|uniref:hypothetical protein n=1 Tax=uncultured Sunxiuqinia sp. TaxID=1573825 RepID=UPI002622E3D2|nr:hypothetical protein [uncultured Sunxiuqinia sp.]
MKRNKKMKQSISIAILVLVSLISCKTKNKEVLIRGQIIGEQPVEIIYTAPTNGICDWAITNSIDTDSLGKFEISFSIDKPSFVVVLAKGFMAFEQSPTIVAEPGETYDLTIDLTSKEQQFVIEGSNNTIQDFYNNLSQANPKTCFFNFKREPADMTGIKKDLFALRQGENLKLNELLEEGKINTEVFNLIKTDRDVYYGTALSTIASMNTAKYIREGASIPDSVSKYWEDANALVSLTNEDIPRTKNLYDFLDLYYWYNIYNSITYSEFSETRAEYREKGLEHTYRLGLANKFFEGENLEYFTVRYIIQNSRRKKENEFIEIIEKFHEAYPANLFSTYLEPVKKVILE